MASYISLSNTPIAVVTGSKGAKEEELMSGYYIKIRRRGANGRLLFYFDLFRHRNFSKACQISPLPTREDLHHQLLEISRGTITLWTFASAELTQSETISRPLRENKVTSWCQHLIYDSLAALLSTGCAYATPRKSCEILYTVSRLLQRIPQEYYLLT
jgi:hypothetical protein